MSSQNTEDSDLRDIERLIETKRQNEEEVAAKIASLTARLSLLEEAVKPTVAEAEETIEERNKLIDHLRKRCDDLSIAHRALRKENSELQRANKSKNRIDGMLAVIAIVLVVAAFVFGYCTNKLMHQRQDEQRQVDPAVVLTMTQAEVDLLRSAARLVNGDLDKFGSVGEALSALYAESPASVRDAVMERLGTVGRLDELPEAVESILERVVVTGGVPMVLDKVDESLPDEEVLPPERTPEVEPEAEEKPTATETPTDGTTLLQRRTLLRR